jgi:hypothetical protein
MRIWPNALDRRLKGVKLRLAFENRQRVPHAKTDPFSRRDSCSNSGPRCGRSGPSHWP